jgi:quercetin dioxygenase-like cupin family protein
LDNSKKNIYTTDEKQPAGEQPDFYANKFIGNFEIRRILNESDSKEQEMYYVTFKDGAMTKIHTHESEQILIATNSSGDSISDMVGKGFVVLIEKGGNDGGGGNTTTEEAGYDEDNSQFNISKTIFLDKIGDTVCIPPNVLHCHGCTPQGVDFSHIAIRRSTLDNKQPAKSLWEYDIEAMKKVMGVTDGNKVSTILKELHVQIRKAISG